MESQLRLDILPQPDDSTCGPTCLQAVYRYYGQDLPLADVIASVPALEGGGTLAVLLACDALRRGYRATIYTYNLHVFDPTWFTSEVDLAERLRAQMALKDDARLRQASEAYLEFLRYGGRMRQRDLTSALIRRHLNKGTPILCGLSATYLYGQMREVGGDTLIDDDLRGVPQGHFVVLCGYRPEQRTVLVADPYQENPLAEGQLYEVSIDRVICAILLGVITYDANLLILEPKGKGE